MRCGFGSSSSGILSKFRQWYVGGCGYQMTSDDPRGEKNCSSSAPGIVVAIRPVPRAQSIAREKLNPTCFTRWKRSTLVLFPADSKNRRRTARGFHSPTI